VRSNCCGEHRSSTRMQTSGYNPNSRSRDIGINICAEEEKRESAYKPGSVVNSHSSRVAVTSDLKRPTRIQRGQRQRIPIWPCSRWGLPCHDVLPLARCALTAPFHPYPCTEVNGRSTLCCTFRRLSPPRRYLAPCPMEPGLSSRVPEGAPATVQLTLGHRVRSH
jgi:hypothetical protein